MPTFEAFNYDSTQICETNAYYIIASVVEANISCKLLGPV